MVLALAMAGILCALPPAQAAESPPDPLRPLLEQAYTALRARDYDAAIAAFRKAAGEAPARASLRKDLAYALLKTGENEAARLEFGEATRLDPSDYHAALEYAFLCHESGETALARRGFDRVRRTGDPGSRATAEQAFRNIDAPLAEGIARWGQAVAADPDNFSARLELARLAERRDETALALEHYEAAWLLRPERRDLLLDLGRLWAGAGQPERSIAALLAASRGAEPLTAERARELMPARYPYLGEFEQALALDPGNTEVRREMAYLLLQMDRTAEAERQFGEIVSRVPDDYLSAAQLGFLLLSRGRTGEARALLAKVWESGDPELREKIRPALGLPPGTPSGGAMRTEAPAEAKSLARKSYEAGYLQDAMKYLAMAHDEDPADPAVMLQLGQAHNMLRQDEQALRWFDLARRGPEPQVAAEAERSYRNLKPSLARLRTTFWAMPFYSTRWHDQFAYAQIKTEIRIGRLPLRPYLSVRFAGDARQTAGAVGPQYLSESSFIAGLGVRTETWRGLTAWAEAGSDISYLDRTDRPGRMAPDYRGGLSAARGFGNPLSGEGSGWFFETAADGVFMSRFGNTFLGNTRNRGGYTPPVSGALGGLETQLCWNGNLTADTKRQEWANFAETGPGLRFRWKWMPRSLVFSADLLRGAYLIRSGSHPSAYTDVRAGFWYAITK